MAYRGVWLEYKNKRWFRGRSTCREWWMELLYLFFVSTLAFSMGPIAGVTIGVWRLILFWAATARRLHDLNQSAWLQVVLMASYFWVVAASLVIDEGTGWFQEVLRPDGIFSTSVLPTVSSVSVFVTLAFCGWLGFFKGTEGPNKWGEDAPLKW